jgi:hypothetical protein
VDRGEILIQCNRSRPFQRNADVARHAAGKVDDLKFDLVTARLKLARPELVHFFGQAGQRCFPAGLLLVDGAAAIRAELVGER